MGCFYKSHSKEQYLWMCIGLSHYHPVIPEERPGDSSGCRHCRKPRKLLLLFCFVKAISDRWPCQRLCSSRVAHARVSLQSRRKPGMNHQVNRWDPAAFLTLQGSERRALPTMKTPHGQMQFGNVGVSVWTRPAVSTWHSAVGMLQALGMSAGCCAATPSHVPVLHCWAPAGAGSAPAEGGSGFDPQLWQEAACARLSGILPLLPSSPSVCALWMMSSSCCLGVHSCVRTAPGEQSSDIDKDVDKIQYFFCLELRINCKQLIFLATS